MSHKSVEESPPPVPLQPLAAFRPTAATSVDAPSNTLEAPVNIRAKEPFDEYLSRHHVATMVDAMTIATTALMGAKDTAPGVVKAADGTDRRKSTAPATAYVSDDPLAVTGASPSVVAIGRMLQCLEWIRHGIIPRRSIASVYNLPDLASVPAPSLNAQQSFLLKSLHGSNWGLAAALPSLLNLMTITSVTISGKHGSKSDNDVAVDSADHDARTSLPSGMISNNVLKNISAAHGVPFSAHGCLRSQRALVLFDASASEGAGVRWKRCEQTAATLKALIDAGQRVLLLPLANTELDVDRHHYPPSGVGSLDVVSVPVPRCYQLFHPSVQPMSVVYRASTTGGAEGIPAAPPKYYGEKTLPHLREKKTSASGRRKSIADVRHCEPELITKWLVRSFVEDVRNIMIAQFNLNLSVEEVHSWSDPFPSYCGSGSSLGGDAPEVEGQEPGVIDPEKWLQLQVVLLPALGSSDPIDQPGTVCGSVIEKCAPYAETVVLDCVSQFSQPRVSVRGLARAVPNGSCLGVAATAEMNILSILTAGPPPSISWHRGISGARGRRRVLVLGEVDMVTLSGLAIEASMVHRKELEEQKRREREEDELMSSSRLSRSMGSPTKSSSSFRPPEVSEPSTWLQQHLDRYVLNLSGHGGWTPDSALMYPQREPALLSLVGNEHVLASSPSSVGFGGARNNNASVSSVDGSHATMKPKQRQSGASPLSSLATALEQITSLFDDIVLLGVTAGKAMKAVEEEDSKLRRKQSQVMMQRKISQDASSSNPFASFDDPPTGAAGFTGGADDDDAVKKGYQENLLSRTMAVIRLLRAKALERSYNDTTGSPISPSVEITITASTDFSVSRVPAPPMNPVAALFAADVRRNAHVKASNSSLSDMGDDTEDGSPHRTGSAAKKHATGQISFSTPSGLAHSGSESHRNIHNVPLDEIDHTLMSEEHGISGLGTNTVAQLKKLCSDASLVVLAGECGTHPALHGATPDGLVECLSGIPMSEGFCLAFGSGPVKAVDSFFAADAPGGLRSADRFMSSALSVRDALKVISGVPIATLVDLPRS